MINTPFNYTGSKYKILNQILPLFDYQKEYFIDLFCGGGRFIQMLHQSIRKF